MTAPCVAHVCADYPDIFRPRNTPVIERLVGGLAPHARNVVISISRVSNPYDQAVAREGDVWAIRYFAPPLGVLHTFFLDRLAKQIAELFWREGVRPRLLLGHKFTVESYICWKLSGMMGLPYIAGFMGNTDCKIFRAKVFSRESFRKVAANARALVFATPWSLEYFKPRLLQPAGVLPERCHLIPYISGETICPTRSDPSNTQRFITICRLDVWRLKNIGRLIKAIRVLRSEGGDWSLDIVGSGSERSLKQLRHLIHENNAESHIRLLGEKTRAEIDLLLPEYTAMVMPSFPESFGLVYLEALAKGVPIMTAMGAGFDGFFKGRFPGVVVAHDSLAAIVQGLRRLSDDGEKFRNQINELVIDFKKFDRESIVSRYAALIDSAI